MRIAIVAWAVAQAALAMAAADARCNADGCARAVTGTGIGPTSSRRAGCSSYQRCTVTPAPTTLTKTAYVTPAPVTQTDVSVATDVVPTTETTLLTFAKRDATGFSLHADLAAARHGKRVAAATSAATMPAAITTAVTVCPTALPQYARATCQAASRYASACSCWGVTKTTTTVTTPTRYVTTTITAPTPTLTDFLTVTTTVLSIIPEPTIADFIMSAAGGQYVGLINEGGLEELVLQSNSAGAQHFRLEKTTVYNLNKTLIVDTDGGTEQTFVYLDDLSDYQNNDFPALVCSVGLYDVTNAGYPLACSGPDRPNLLTENGRNNLALATDVPPGFGAAPQLYAVKP